ncbi:MAG: osmoprotectant transporter permease [Saprospiraceae bacterium]|nr:osmoprotectant transporter permease [Candidatus Opimibacter iunctus]
MNLFTILWYFTAIMSLVPVYFFFIGLKDGSITTRNFALWLLILLIIAGVLIGSNWLRDHDRLNMAEWLLGLAAVPGLLVLLYFIVVLIGKPKWN